MEFKTNNVLPQAHLSFEVKPCKSSKHSSLQYHHLYRLQSHLLPQVSDGFHNLFVFLVLRKVERGTVAITSVAEAGNDVIKGRGETTTVIHIRTGTKCGGYTQRQTYPLISDTEVQKFAEIQMDEASLSHSNKTTSSREEVDFTC